MTKKNLIAIPAYNEAQNLASLLSNITKYGIDILVINDGSTDETQSVIEKFNTLSIQHANNRGLSEVYKSFTDFALKNNYSSVITLDGDGQHNPEYIPLFAKNITNNEIVIGNRFSSISNIPKEKISSNFFASMVVNSVYNMFVPDVSCGFRAYSTTFLESFIFSDLSFDIIYQTIFECLSRSHIPSYINMPANYQNQPLVTKSQEILSLLRTTMVYQKTEFYTDLYNKIYLNKSFSTELLGNKFEFIYKTDNAYVISTDMKKVMHWYENN